LSGPRQDRLASLIVRIVAGASAAWLSSGSQQFASFTKADGLDRVSDVPEPATLASLTLGLGLIAGLRRRRNKQA
jgi:hypothetical protein